MTTENEVQSSVITLFELKGWDVLTTSRRGIFCHKCHRKVYGPDGASKGTPDLFVSPKGSGNHWVGIEIKGEKTNVSVEQKELADRGKTFIVRSLDEAIELEKRLRNG